MQNQCSIFPSTMPFDSKTFFKEQRKQQIDAIKINEILKTTRMSKPYSKTRKHK